MDQEEVRSVLKKDWVGGGLSPLEPSLAAGDATGGERLVGRAAAGGLFY